MRRRHVVGWGVGVGVAAFAKIRRPDERFVALVQNVAKLEASIDAVEKLQIRIAKRHADMIIEIADVGSSFALLSGTESLGSDALEATGRVFEKSLVALRTLVCAARVSRMAPRVPLTHSVLAEVGRPSARGAWV